MSFHLSFLYFVIFVNILRQLYINEKGFSSTDRIKKDTKEVVKYLMCYRVLYKHFE